MKLNDKLIQSIIKRFPDTERIFQWYEIQLTEEVMLMKLEAACDHFNIEAEDLLLDLEDVIAESRNTDWLSPDADDEDTQWTEGFTDESGTDTGLSFDEETMDAPTDLTDMGSEDYDY